jgi:excisionase family DNA binding protein
MTVSGTWTEAVTDAIKGSRRQSRATLAEPYVVSVPEAAELLGISKDLAYDLARRGELPGAIQLGRRWRVSLVKLRAALHGPEDRVTQDAGQLPVARLDGVRVHAQRD